MSIFKVKIDEDHTLRGNDYRIEHPKANFLVLTGMQEHSTRYRPFALRMNSVGYNVHVLDHFGQGENAKSIEDQQKWPIGAWDMVLKALNEKVNELRKEGLPVYMMGHSMGSFFMQSYLEHYPKSVDKIIIMSSNGPGLPYGLAKTLSNLTTTKANWDKPSHFIDRLTVGGYKIKGQKTKLDWLSYNEENVREYMADEYCGAKNTNGFYHEFLKGMATLYKKKNKDRISKEEHILIICGAEDPVGGRKGNEALYRMYRKLGVKDVTLKVHEKMRHEILNEKKSDEVIQDIQAFLDGKGNQEHALRHYDR